MRSQFFQNRGTQFLIALLAILSQQAVAKPSAFTLAVQDLAREMTGGGARVVVARGDDISKMDEAIEGAKENASRVKGHELIHWYPYRGFLGADSQTVEPFLTPEQQQLKNKNPLEYQSLVNSLREQMRTNPIAFAEQYITQKQGRAVIVIHDYIRFSKEAQTGKLDIAKVTALRDLTEKLRSTNSQAYVILKEEGDVTLPAEVSKYIETIDFPLPSEDEIKELVQGIIDEHNGAAQDQISMNESEMDAVVDALNGMTEARIQNFLISSLGKHKRIDLEYLKERKRLVIQSEGLLDIFEPTDEQIGGYALLQNDIAEEGATLKDSEFAEEFGSELSKGILLLGVPGVGKSLTVKAAGKILGLKVIRLDGSKILDKYVGESEAKTERLIKMITKMQPAILWLDELEKLFAGLENSSGGDGGTMMRVLQQLLTWLNDQEGIYVMATANSIRNLPPELLDRFPVKYAMLPPNVKDSADIFRIQLKKRTKKRSKTFPAMTNIEELALELASQSVGYTGRNIEQAIRASLKTKFREVAIEADRMMREDGITVRAEAMRKAYEKVGDISADLILEKMKEKGRFIDAYRRKFLDLLDFIEEHEVKLAAEPDEDTKKLMAERKAEKAASEGLGQRLQQGVGVDCAAPFSGEEPIETLQDLARAMDADAATSASD